MQIEYEVKFINIDKDDIRQRLKAAGAELVRPEFLQKRFNFHLPGNLREDNAWLRKCCDCGVLPLLYKLCEGVLIEDKGEIRKLKKEILHI